MYLKSFSFNIVKKKEGETLLRKEEGEKENVGNIDQFTDNQFIKSILSRG